MRELKIELGRMRVPAEIFAPLRIVWTRRIPITSDLTEAMFIERLDEIETARFVTDAALDNSLVKVKPGAKR